MGLLALSIYASASVFAMSTSGYVTGAAADDAMPALWKISDSFDTAEELANSSEIIVLGVVSSDNDKFSYLSDWDTYTITKVQIEKCYRGNISNDAIIDVLQTDMNEDPLIKQGDRMFLFLYEYEGPIIDAYKGPVADVYMIEGAYQGQFLVDGDDVKKVTEVNAGGIDHRDMPSTLGAFEAIIEESEYVPKAKAPKRTQEEIDRINAEERRLEKEFNGQNDADDKTSPDSDGDENEIGGNGQPTVQGGGSGSEGSSAADEKNGNTASFQWPWAIAGGIVVLVLIAGAAVVIHRRKGRG
jgi:hypothetical protein